MVGSYKLKAIFKNGKVNGSIFEDGLTKMLQSDLIAETWGRPIMAPWCGSSSNKYKVGNSIILSFDDTITWKQTQDHSKWTLPLDDRSNYACLGDMNRMESQFKRGGAFYCLESKPLRLAMKGLIQTTA
jgi:deoxyribonuclease II